MLRKIEITDREEWLKFREQNINSTESCSLFGIQAAYQPTIFELYHQKMGNISSEIKDNDFLLAGRLFEPVVAEMVKIKNPDWIVEPLKIYAYDDEDRIGSSFDYLVTLPDGQKGIMEVKTISAKEFGKKYSGDSDDLEAPAHYEVQMQHQLEVLNEYDFCIMAVMILDTRTLVIFRRERDIEMGKNIRDAVKKFWSMTSAPEPDYSLDKSVLAKVLPKANPEEIMDATNNTRLSELSSMYKAEKELEKQSKENADTFYAEILDIIGTAKVAWTNDYRITATDVKGNDGIEITPDMVGQRINVLSGYKKLTITEVKK